MRTNGQHSDKMKREILPTVTTKESIGSGTVSHEPASFFKAVLVLAAEQLLDHKVSYFQ